MGKHAAHILISCSPEDAKDMHILMQGMMAHSDFIHWRLNDFFEEAMDLQAAGIDWPVLQIWHGFTVPGFAWEVLASLLASVHWKKESGITIQIEVDMALESYGVRDFFHAVREGRIK